MSRVAVVKRTLKVAFATLAFCGIMALITWPHWSDIVEVGPIAVLKIKMLGGTFTVDSLRTGDIWVCLSGTKVTDADLACLKQLTKLRSLSLIDTKITDAGLENLRGLTHLKALDLAGTDVTDAGLKNIEGLIKLRSLNLMGTKVTDAGMRYLKGLTQLESLDS